ncbi:hypothetical protein LEN26_006077 [Aphanomyces euteiches]|nr:hypothetical protein AeMF1_003345 [Aphanomyces euteiches]KAH9136615.1 hypothetical protein LEN26_006077 [Aphanomyces euteiches]KAH9189486.1 hypothetical protein AeNC1_008546 [Aphanomyces euteiches]
MLQLLEKNPSSQPALEKLTQLAEDRKEARVVEKLEQESKDVVRRCEESYRADFMKCVATELARIGAPSMITWQRLVHDKDCNYQAIRILLTKIKSSQKKRSMTLPVIELKPREALPLQRSPSQDSTLEQQTLPRRSISADNRPAWNNDFIEDPSSFVESSSFSRLKRLPPTPQTQVFKPEEPSQAPTTTKNNDAKLKAITKENASLKKELQELQAMHDAFVREETEASGREGFARRSRFLQAQNLQLQRQVDMLLEAVALRHQTADDLDSVVASLQKIVEKGRAEAKDAGAEQDQNIAWMMAIPTSLLAELNQVSSRLKQIKYRCSMEAPLRQKDGA